MLIWGTHIALDRNHIDISDLRVTRAEQCRLCLRFQPTSPAALPAYTTCLAVPCPLADEGTVVMEINVPFNYQFTSVSAVFSGLHPYVRDFDLRLYPANDNTFQSSVELSSRNGGSGHNMQMNVFDQSCGTNVQDGAAPFRGCYRPEGNLTRLVGMFSTQGTWRLRVMDTEEEDAGSYSLFALAFCVPVCL